MIYDVIVVGAGAAGLSAARQIKMMNANLKVIVLEAKGRVGGRTLTLPVDIGCGKTENFDLGGQWVSSDQTHVIDMLNDLDLDTYPQYTTGIKRMQLGDNKVRSYTSDIPSFGSVRGLIELQLFLWKMERWAAQTPITDPYRSPHASTLEGHTVDSFMRTQMSCKPALETIDVACKAAFGTDASRISALFFLAYGNAAGGVMKVFETKNGAAQELRVKGGTQQISKLLVEKIGKDNVYLDHPVCGLEQNEETVLVRTENGKEFPARRVILAAPPNIYPKITFIPSLPPYKKLIYENLPIGHLIKFIVVYKKAFWREGGFSGEIVSNGGETNMAGVSCGPLSFCIDATSHLGTPAIVGFIAGRQGVEWENKTESERKTAVLKGLSTMLGPEAGVCVSYTEKIWSQEDYIGGCPVMFGVPGCMYAFPHLRLPFDKLHFAGTETATEWTGFISGAIQSGERAAKEVLHNLSPNVLCQKDLLGTCYDPKSLPQDFRLRKSEASILSVNSLLFLAVLLLLMAILYAWIQM